MTKVRLLSAAVIPALLACGCSNLSHTENGALAGGAIGAGVGALSGGLIGNAVDKSEQKVQAAQAQSQMGLTDVVQMTQSHISDDIIINQIRTRGTVFQLSAQDTIWLKQNGVSDRVIAEMQATAARVPRRCYSAEPVYVVEPAPPVVGVGFGYTHYGHRW